MFWLKISGGLESDEESYRTERINPLWWNRACRSKHKTPSTITRAKILDETVISFRSSVIYCPPETWQCWKRRHCLYFVKIHSVDGSIKTSLGCNVVNLWRKQARIRTVTWMNDMNIFIFIHFEFSFLYSFSHLAFFIIIVRSRMWERRLRRIY